MAHANGQVTCKSGTDMTLERWPAVHPVIGGLGLDSESSLSNLGKTAGSRQKRNALNTPARAKMDLRI